MLTRRDDRHSPRWATMTAQASPPKVTVIASRSKATRRRRRRISTKALVLLAAAGCLALLIGRGTAQVVSRLSCSTQPLTINVSVSTDIAPAVQRISDVFNSGHHEAGGKCVSVEITVAPSAQTTSEVDGQRPGQAHKIDAWIPDSSLWVGEARGFAVGATTVQPAGFSVAHSPLMLVMPSAATAAQVKAFGKFGWRLLLPAKAGGPHVPGKFRVDLPDPTQSAAGLSAIVQISRLLGTGPSARVRFARFAASTEVTPYFDDPVSLTTFVSLGAPPLDGLPVTVTTEQAVLAYDAANPHTPVAANYPTGSSAAFGSPELDYPFVTTTSSTQRQSAAKVFGRFLTTPYARAVIRYAGFRAGPGNGVPDKFPAADGLNDQLLQVATPASASEAPTALQAWNTIALGSRNLALVDVSSAMAVPADPAAPTGPTLEQEMSQTAALGLPLFADTSRVGLWEFADHLTGKLPYKQLVPIGPLLGNFGPITRRDQLAKVAGQLQANGGDNVALYGSILDAYEFMQNSYQSKFVNTVVVLTSGVESAPGDITGPALVNKLSKLANPARKVTVIIIIFGVSPIYHELQKIAHTTGGQAYQITKPSDVGKVFFRAVAHRLCSTNCVSA